MIRNNNIKNDNNTSAKSTNCLLIFINNQLSWSAFLSQYQNCGLLSQGNIDYHGTY